MTDSMTETAIREMQDATLSYMLTDDDHVRQSFAVASALGTARTEAIDAASDDDGVVLVASLAFVSMLFTHCRLHESLRVSVRASDNSAWCSSGVPTRVDDDLVVTGVRLAVRRFDADPVLIVTSGDISIERAAPGE